MAAGFLMREFDLASAVAVGATAACVFASHRKMLRGAGVSVRSRYAEKARVKDPAKHRKEDDDSPKQSPQCSDIPMREPNAYHQAQTYPKRYYPQAS